MTGRWEDCPCCGAPTFAAGSLQDHGTPVPCGCDCWVSVDDDGYGAMVGYIAMGDGPCPACNIREEWLDGPDSEAARAARGFSMARPWTAGYVAGYRNGREAEAAAQEEPGR